MNRGSSFRDALIQFQIPASMRPRFMNRGSSGEAAEVGPDQLRFNEAPIHESGKCRIVAHDEVDPGIRFNEAPIHESGK